MPLSTVVGLCPGLAGIEECGFGCLQVGRNRTFSAVSALFALVLLPTLSVAGSFHQQEITQDQQRLSIRKTESVLRAAAMKSVEPNYPPLARAARVTGAVVVEVTVDEGGNVISAQVLSGHPLLKEASVTAAKQWIFRPWELTAFPAKVTGILTFNFESDIQKQIRECSEQVRDHPESAEAYYRLGDALASSERYDVASAERDSQARPWFEEAIRLNPKLGAVYLDLGRVQERAGERPAAVDSYKEAIRLGAVTAQMSESVARELLEIKAFDLAIPLLERATKDRVSLISDGMDLRTTLINAYLDAGRAEEAIAEGKLIVDIEPGNLQSRLLLGHVYLEVHRSDDAITELEVTIQMEPSSVEAHFQLAEAFLAKGDKASAWKEYKVVEQLDPDGAGDLKKEIENGYRITRMIQ